MSDPATSERARMLETAIDASMDGVAILDDDGDYRYVNPAHAKLHGYDGPERLVGESWRALYSEEEVERFESEVLPRLERNGEWRGEAIGLRRDGTEFAQEVSLTRTPDGIVCVVTDATERRRWETRLERYRTILENIHDAVYALDADGTITWVNDVAVEAFDVGYDRDDLVGAHVSTVLSDEDIERCLALIQDLLEHDERTSARCQIAIQTAYGGEIPCDLHLALLPFEDGEFQGTVGVVRDITEQQRREQRLAVLNRALRHNLRNHATIVRGHAASLADGLEGDQAEAAGVIRDHAERLASMGEKARRIESALERNDRSPMPIELVERVEERCGAVRDRYLGAEIRVQAPDTGWVAADEMVDGVVDNLVENAIEHHDGSAPEVTVTVEVASNGVELRVEDDGPGIPPEEIAVLDAGTETPLRHGTGLGLWMVNWLVDSYGGDLSFDTGPTGSTVTVWFRRAEHPDAG